MKHPPKKINLFLLVLLIVSAIDSIRNLPASALFGSMVIFFFLFAALVFLIPTALVSAELSSALPEKGGVYHWMTKAFGDKIGMLSIWLQWINTMVWYPTILSFIAGTAAYLINPSLIDNKFYLISMILILFWSLTIVNLFGLKVSATINSIFGLIGTMIPMVFLIVLGVIWAVKGKPAQISFHDGALVPTLKTSANWVSLTAIMASFLGIELAGVHVNDIQDPQRNFPKAMGYSSFFLIFTMLFGSLTIAYVLPEKEINLVAGVMQVFTNFFHAFNIPWATPVLGVLIFIGSLGSIINWLISPAKGLLHAAEYGFLPAIFKKRNKHDVAYNILFAQALLVSLLCLVFFLVPSVNAFYWFLTGLSTNLYMLMYVLMFLSAIKLYYSFDNRPLSFRIPGKHIGLWITCLLGLFGCSLTIFVGFFPPSDLHISIGYYSLLMTLGTLLMITPIFLFYWYRYQKTHKH
jgi:amino acid transporter